jgi:small subunit ribosomal protein S18
MAAKKSKRQIKRVPKVKVNCYFCHEKKSPDYKEYKELTTYISERGKIIAKAYSGVCSKHQRRISIAIKRARHLGLLPYIASIR